MKYQSNGVQTSYTLEDWRLEATGDRLEAYTSIVKVVYGTNPHSVHDVITVVLLVQ